MEIWSEAGERREEDGFSEGMWWWAEEEKFDIYEEDEMYSGEETRREEIVLEIRKS